MRRGLLIEPGKFEVREDVLEEPGEGEVRLRVEAAGICGTDLEVFRGHIPSGWTVTFPFQMGHELVGIVDAVGRNVPHVKVGDRVVPDGRIPCGYCRFCRKGQVNACEHGGYRSGGFQEYCVYNHTALVSVPATVSVQEAAMTEPISCTLYGNAKLDVAIGSLAVVIGEGAIGLLHAQLLKSRGANVIVVGLIEKRLQIAKTLGIEHIINANEEDPVEAVQRISAGRGADCVVVAAGVQTALRQALHMAGRYGQILYFAANMQQSCSMPMDLIHYKELKVIGSYDSTTAYFEQALTALASGLINVKPMITHTFELADIQKAFETANAGEGMKIMIVNDTTK